MIKQNTRVNLFIAAGKYTSDPDDLIWVPVLTNWPAFIRQVDNELPYHRPDGEEQLYEYEIFVPMSDGDWPRGFLLVRSARILISVELGIFGDSQWNSVDLQWDGTQIKILANKIDPQNLPAI